MNWILLIWVFTGGHHGVQTIEFATSDQCEAAQVWVEEAGKGNWTKRYQPKAKCFRKLR